MGDAETAMLTEPTATDRVYAAVYEAILELRLVPGTRLREEELAGSFEVSRTVVRQALQRLAQDGLVELQHNRGAQVVVPTPELAAQVFDARRVVECEIARRLGGQLSAPQMRELHTLVVQEAAADKRGDRARAIALSGRLHRTLAVWDGNPIFVRLLEGLLPTTTLLMAMYTSGERPACVSHRHIEIERSLSPQAPPAVAARDVFAHYREVREARAGPRVPRAPRARPG
jgi:DNA-binding GntR family transcriptional regulator